SNLLEVVVAGDGRLPFRSAIVKFLSSLITIGTGGSIGREGGITQLSATFASKLGQIAGWPPYRLRLLVGCGDASGIAAAYNAPISGAVFAAPIVLGYVSLRLIATLATVGSGAVGGVFTPTLFLGAGLGASFALALQKMGVGEDLPISTFAVVGMGSMLAATTRSPLLAMIMVFEISLDYSLMP